MHIVHVYIITIIYKVVVDQKSLLKWNVDRPLIFLLYYEGKKDCFEVKRSFDLTLRIWKKKSGSESSYQSMVKNVTLIQPWRQIFQAQTIRPSNLGLKFVVVLHVFKETF